MLFFYQKKQTVYQKNMEGLKSDYDKALLKTQLEIKEQIFQAISRDIHDNITLSLTLAKLNLTTIDQINKEKSTIQVNNSIDLISKAIIDLTDISRCMNSEIISEQGLISALKQETEKLKKLNRYIVAFEVSGNPVFMDAQKELFIFRIVQEAFNNILKHAGAKKIILDMNYTQNYLDFSVTDDGVGFTKSLTQEIKDHPLTAGLRNMQKRAELLNGCYLLETFPGKGTTIKISIPFN
jgi:signal transduction histidine kinase